MLSAALLRLVAAISSISREEEKWSIAISPRTLFERYIIL